MLIKNKGFTLPEVLIALLIVLIVVISITGALTTFANYARKDYIYTCLVQSAVSGLNAAKANSTLTQLNVSCGGFEINVEIDTESISSNCIQITSTASLQNREFNISDINCEF